MNKTQKHEIMYIISFRFWQFITLWLYPLWTWMTTSFPFFHFFKKQIENKETKEEQPPTKSDTDIYVEKAQQSFLKLFDAETNDNDNNTKKPPPPPNWNENVDSILYDREKVSEIMEDPNNELEKAWRRRILMESTPRGNIILYFDVFQTAFLYYSDQQMVPYAILNAAAMKYVTRFRCLDFFHDSSTLPDGKTSKLMEVIDAYDTKRVADEKPKVNMDWKKNAPFLKPINKNKPLPQSTTEKEKEAKEQKEKNEQQQQQQQQTKKKTVNRFKHQGKLANFSVLQTPRKVNPLNGVEPGAEMKTLASGHSEFKAKKMSYAEYKKLLMMESSSASSDV